MRRKSHLTAEAFTVCLLAFFAVFGCDKKPTGVTEIPSTQFPNSPDSIRVVVGDQVIIVKWSFADSNNSIQKFNIYRATSTPTSFSLIQSSTASSFEDRNIQNNVDYFYQVTAVNKEGFESKRSEVIAAKAGQFNVVIEGGAEYTATQEVQVAITASTALPFMLLSNDSSFSNAVPQPFDNSIDWMLPNRDGLKTVYVRLQDQSGKSMSLPIKDTIFLDTQASISSVTENSGGSQKVAGETVRIVLNAGESGGKAHASIENGPQNLKLFDDGSNGDVLANDGLYTLDYVIQQGDDVFQSRVTGQFSDRVNNVAQPVNSTTRLTIRYPPDPVTLFSPVLDFDATSGQIGLKLSWTESDAVADFASYLVYRSLTPNIPQDSTNLIIGSIPSRQTGEFLDQRVVRNNTYYYKIVVTDMTGLTAESNVVSGTTPQ